MSEEYDEYEEAGKYVPPPNLILDVDGVLCPAIKGINSLPTAEIDAKLNSIHKDWKNVNRQFRGQTALIITGRKNSHTGAATRELLAKCGIVHPTIIEYPEERTYASYAAWKIATIAQYAHANSIIIDDDERIIEALTECGFKPLRVVFKGRK